MNALAQAQRTIAFPASTSMSAIAADALTRIPVAHFRGMPWATDSIAACTTMLTDAARGDRATVAQWIYAAQADSDVRPLVSVLCAVCDSVVAAAYRARGDAAAVRTFVAALERDVLGRLAEHQRQTQNDPAAAKLGASLVQLVELHDPKAARHLETTAVLARRVAVEMQLPADRVDIVELAARLHDIGNISIRHDVLYKRGPLTVSEWREVRRHADCGAKVLEDTPQLAHLAPIVRAHHELVDGTGYPDGLIDAAIPLESRIIAVAAAFVAMTTERPHRGPVLPAAALLTIDEQAGRQFDVDVVAATCALFGFTRRMRDAIA